MKYISTRVNSEKVSFKQAVVNGTTDNGGLYFPEDIPLLPKSFFDSIENLSDQEIAFKVLKPFVEDSLNETQLKNILAKTLVFPTPVVSVEKSINCLELFHGPTQAFKDMGARFMAACLSEFYGNEDKEVQIVVATSGDTGSAVASGFYKVPHVKVKVLFPKGKVSPYQEFQMTSLGENITAIEVDGTFDDCQSLVKQALNDTDLNTKVTLSSANSINIARLLPQTLYYFFAYKQLKLQLTDKEWIVSVPSGNLGNLTAGLLAKKMGLAVQHFLAAHNDNDTFYLYWKNGKFEPKASVQTYSNAMDVGNPSNFERISMLYQNNWEAIKKDITAYTFSNEQTLSEIKKCFDEDNYLLDPHGAVGKLALDNYLKTNQIGTFLATAHPQKFSEIIQKTLPEFQSEKVDLSNCHKIEISKDYNKLTEIILTDI